MDTVKNAQKAIDGLDNYEFFGQTLEVRMSDQDTAKQYPTSKFKKRGKRDRDGGDYDRRDYRDEKP